jgi:hypothetical protein
VQALGGELLAETGSVGERHQARQASPGRPELRPKRLDQHRGQLRVGLVQPAAEGDAVGLVVDPLRVELVQFGEHRAFHQLAVQRRHAVDAVRPRNARLPMRTAAAVVFFDQRHRAQHVEVVQAFGPQRVDMVGVDQVDDLHVPRHALHQRDRPGFQGFGQQRVVGVGDSVPTVSSAASHGDSC